MPRAYRKSNVILPPMEAGQRYGRLVAVEKVGKKGRAALWSFRCDCGNDHIALANNVRRGICQSCGCAQRKQISERAATHRMTGSPEHRVWHLMIQRCTNPKATQAIHYHGRGIKVCDRWRSFENFYADMGPRPEGMTLDRIDNDGDYDLGNCRWATNEVQSRNKRSNRWVTFQGKRMCITDALKLVNLDVSSFYARLKKGWSVDRALSQPRREPSPPLMRPKL